MPMQKIRELEKTRGNLHEVIPSLVNQYGQHRTAKQLGVSVSTINKWLKDHRYKMVIIYVPEGYKPEIVPQEREQAT